MAAGNGEVNPAANNLWDLVLGLERWGTVLDVGANYGEMVAGATIPEGAHVVAFEPNPSVADCLRETVRKLPFEVDVQEVALGAVADEAVELEIADAWTGKSRVLDGSTASDDDDHHVVPVPMTTIDAIFGDSPPASLSCKIDVEGLELQVLAGGEKTLQGAGRVAIMLEILHMPMQELATLGRKFPIFLATRDGRGLVRWQGTDPAALGRLVHAEGMHRENALILAGSDVREFTKDVQDRSERSVRRVVYTALLGSYEPLREQPAALDTNVDFICFTDDPSLTSSTWRLELVEPEFPHDLVRSARSLKIRGHALLEQYDESIWIDNRVELKQDPNLVLDSFLADSDMAVMYHGFRTTLTEEFAAVVDGGYDDVSRVYEQLISYSTRQDAIVDQRPLWTGFMARRKTDSVRRAMNAWMDQVLRYSRRDQLSLTVALADTKVKVRKVADNNRESEWHRWPQIDKAERARRSRHTDAISQAVQLPLARLAKLEHADGVLIDALQQSAVTRDAELRRLRVEVEALTRDRMELRHVKRGARRLKAERDQLRADLRTARQTVRALQRSRAVRLANAIRRISGRS
jgi:FkbM family methyltransferase